MSSSEALIPVIALMFIGCVATCIFTDNIWPVGMTVLVIAGLAKMANSLDGK